MASSVTGPQFVKGVSAWVGRTVVLLVILNLFSITAYHSYLVVRSADRYSSLPDVVRQNYDHLDADSVTVLLNETWKPGWTYEEILGFKEKPRKGKFVNVNSFGFRSKVDGDQFKELLKGGCWFFGGSTTFGYGVGDLETIPYLLGEELNCQTINLGRGFYYSLQENLLFENMLASGLRPSKVVFLDGINERCSIKTYQKQMEIIFSMVQKKGMSLEVYIVNLTRPLLSLTAMFLSKLGLPLPQYQQNKDFHANECKAFGVGLNLYEVLQTNLEKRKLICESYNVSCSTFLQPFAGLHGQHLSRKDLNEESRQIFRNKFNHLRNVFLSEGAIDLTNSLDTLNKHAFVDGVHYSYEANKVIARNMSSILIEQPTNILNRSNKTPSTASSSDLSDE